MWFMKLCKGNLMHVLILEQSTKLWIQHPLIEASNKKNSNITSLIPSSAAHKLKLPIKDAWRFGEGRNYQEGKNEGAIICHFNEINLKWWWVCAIERAATLTLLHELGGSEKINGASNGTKCTRRYFFFFFFLVIEDNQG